LEFLKSQAAHQANLPLNKVSNIVFLRKNIDARSHLIKYILKVRIFLTTENYKPINYKDLISNNNVKKQPEIHIVGLGPAGLFAAVKDIELGLKPLVFERGKEVKNRRRDLANLIKNGQVNPNSNYCFCEGGA